MLSLLRNLLFPPKCAGCDELIPIADWRRGEECLCRTCRAAWETAKLEVCPECHESMIDCRCMTHLLEEAGMQSLRKLMWYGAEEGNQRTVGDRLLYHVKDGHVIAYERFLSDQLYHGALSEMKYRGWLLTDEQGKTPFETIVTYCPRSPRKVREREPIRPSAWHGGWHPASVCHLFRRLRDRITRSRKCWTEKHATVMHLTAIIFAVEDR